MAEIRQDALEALVQAVAERDHLRAKLARVEAECVQWTRLRDPNIDRVIAGGRAAAAGDDRD